MIIWSCRPWLQEHLIHCVKVSVFGVILVRIFPYLDWVTPNTDTQYVVIVSQIENVYTKLGHEFKSHIGHFLYWIKKPWLISMNYEVITPNRSNNSVFLYLKIYWNRQVFDLIRASGIWMKLEMLRHQAPSSKC